MTNSNSGPSRGPSYLDFPDSAREIGRTGALLGNLLFTKISSNTSTVRPRPLLFVSPSGSNGRRWKRFNIQHCGILFHLIFGRQHVHPHAGGVQAAITTSASTLGGQAVVETKSQHFCSVRARDRPVDFFFLRVQLLVLIEDICALDEDLDKLGLHTPRKTRFSC